MGLQLVDADESAHEVGTASNWNESRYVDFWDSAQARSAAGSASAIDQRAACGNVARASTCPTVSVAFIFARPKITAIRSRLAARLAYRFAVGGDARVVLGRNDSARRSMAARRSQSCIQRVARVHAANRAHDRARGLGSVMGFDQDHIDRIFLPGQADLHYQHLTRTDGSRPCGRSAIGRAGPRRQGPLVGCSQLAREDLPALADRIVDDDHGFMLVRAVGPTKQTRSGFVWEWPVSSRR